jgi:hypothetical protein
VGRVEICEKCFYTMGPDSEDIIDMPPHIKLLDISTREQ